MAKEIDASVGGAIKKMKKVYAGVGGAVKEMKKGYCGVGGAVKTFYETNVITSISYPDSPYTWGTGNGYTYISWGSNWPEQRETQVYMYGDFAGKTYSITGYSSGQSADLLLYKSDGNLVSYSYDYIREDTWNTISGTFPADTSYIKFRQYTHSEYMIWFRLRSFVIDGVDRMNEIKACCP